VIRNSSRDHQGASSLAPFISGFVGFADKVVLLDDRVDSLLGFNCVAAHGDTIMELALRQLYIQ
jgi:hypothetical protein